LATLPEWFGQLSNLQKLNLENNKLNTFRWHLKNLQTLDLAGNNLDRDSRELILSLYSTIRIDF